MKTDKESQDNAKSVQTCVSVSVTDLRIGNYLLKSLKSGNGRKINDKIGVQDIVRIYENTGSFNYEPIQLTEEWLGNFRFEKFLNQFKESSGYKPFILLFLDGFYEYDDLRFSTKIKYVHQLQNLYHALTGSELQISSITEH